MGILNIFSEFTFAKAVIILQYAYFQTVSCVLVRIWAIRTDSVLKKYLFFRPKNIVKK
jgi:hypothetical protein